MASVAAGEVTDHEEKRALVSAERGRTGEGRRKPDTAERGDGISQFSVLPSKSCGIQLRRSDEPTMAKAQGPCLVNPRLKGGINPTNPD